ncbi:M91 family zinc metallopeptidase [Propylenella binzhouense]|nr:M91 family zinc metallopeptidase [Propylenella binzhouense]
MPIKVTGPDDYRKTVEGLLQKLEANPAGKVVLGEIRGFSDEVRIEPYNKGKQALHGGTNSSVSEDNLLAGAPDGVSGRGPGYWYRGRSDDPRTPLRDERDTLMPPSATATGAGTGSRVYFSPELYDPTSKIPAKWPDAVLVHELVHSLRYLQGLQNPIPTKEAVWENEEEYLAVIVENVYVSAAGGHRLRRGHGLLIPLAPPLNTSAGFLDFEMGDPGNKFKPNLDLLKIHQLVWATFDKLAMVQAPFNPFRELANRNRHLFRKDPKPPPPPPVWWPRLPPM